MVDYYDNLEKMDQYLVADDVQFTRYNKTTDSRESITKDTFFKDYINPFNPPKPPDYNNIFNAHLAPLDFVEVGSELDTLLRMLNIYGATAVAGLCSQLGHI